MLAVLVGVPRPGLGPRAAWLLALAVAALAFAALGVAIGALAREVRAASLLAFMLALPVAALALIPSGSVSGRLYDVIRIVSGVFPFKPALSALDGALSGGELLLPLVHLAALDTRLRRPSRGCAAAFHVKRRGRRPFHVKRPRGEGMEVAWGGGGGARSPARARV